MFFCLLQFMLNIFLFFLFFTNENEEKTNTECFEMSAVIKLIKTRSLVLKLTSLGLDLSLEGSGLSLKERLEKKIINIV